jgi:hypothetical protein
MGNSQISPSDQTGALESQHDGEKEGSHRGMAYSTTACIAKQSARTRHGEGIGRQPSTGQNACPSSSYDDDNDDDSEYPLLSEHKATAQSGSGQAVLAWRGRPGANEDEGDDGGTLTHQGATDGKGGGVQRGSRWPLCHALGTQKE